MPTRSRIQSVAVELTEIIPKLGYEVEDFLGPISPEGEEIPGEETEDDTEYQYYLTGDAAGSKFYIELNTSREFATIVYPMNVLKHLSKFLNDSEVESILSESIDLDNVDEERKEEAYLQAVKAIIDNTEPVEFRSAAFTLSAYASTVFVSYRQTAPDGFPTEFQCTRGIFPYDEQLTLQYVDDRLVPVLIAGERGRRYVEYSFIIEKNNKDPSEYEFRAMF